MTLDRERAVASVRPMELNRLRSNPRQELDRAGESDAVLEKLDEGRMWGNTDNKVWLVRRKVNEKERSIKMTNIIMWLEIFLSSFSILASLLTNTHHAILALIER